MKFKKLLSMAVAGAMILAMSVPAFAWGGDDGGWGSDPVVDDNNNNNNNNNDAETAENEIAVTSSVEKPTVKVTVPNSGAVILNPYQMKFTVSGTDYYKPFFSAPIICKNESDCDINVSASATAKVEGEVKIVDAANAVQTTEAGDKNVFLQMASGTFADKDATAFKQEKTDLKITFEKADTGYGYGPKGTGITIEDKYLNLPYSEDATYFGFLLSGDVNKNTSKVWADTDKVSVTIVLTFIPQAIAANANK